MIGKIKPKVVLVGPCIGEMYWEFGRFAPYVMWKREQEYKSSSIKFIVLTRQTMFDLYAGCASVFVPLSIPGDGTLYKPNCFRLDDFPDDAYNFIIKTFYNKYSKNHQIVEHLKPDVSRKNFLNKNQFPRNKMLFNYYTRIENNTTIEKNTERRPFVILAPRYRKGLKRNWPHWQKLYDLIYDDKRLFEKYNFMICGKYPDYIPDKYERFLDVNKFNTTTDVSLIGLTIESIRKAELTVGSQSAIPNISLLFKVPVLEWGHQKQLHTIEYNPFKTRVTFIEDMNYTINPETVYSEMLKLL